MDWQRLEQTLQHLESTFVFELANIKAPHLTFEKLFNLHIVTDGVKIRWLGRDFYCTNTTEFFTTHLLAYQDEELGQDFTGTTPPAKEKDYYYNQVIKCMTSSEKLSDFHCETGVDFMQWRRGVHWAQPTLMPKENMNDIINFVAWSKNQHIDYATSVVAYVQNIDKILLKEKLQAFLSEKNIHSKPKV